MRMSPATRRAWVALGLGEFFFSLLFLPFAVVSIPLQGVAADPQPGEIGHVVGIVAFAVAAVGVGLPVGVHTLGRFVESRVRDLPRSRAALIHGAVSLGVGLLAATGMAIAGLSPAVAAVVAFALPVAAAAYLTRWCVDVAERRTWVSVLSWVLAQPGFVLVALAVAWVTTENLSFGP